MANERITGLSSQPTENDALLVEVDDASFIESKSMTIELINEKTRAGAGLNTNGSYAAPSGSNYIDAATDIHVATELLDAAIKTNADAIETLSDELDSRIQTAAVTIPAATIIDQITEGIELIAAPGAGKFIEPIAISAKVNYSSVEFNAAGDFQIGTSGFAIEAFILDSANVDATSTKYFKLYDNNRNADIAVNKELLLISPSPVTAGNGSITFYITYRIVTL